MGVKDPAAGLVAEIAIAVFKTAFARWVESDDGPDLPQIMQESLEELKVLAGGAS